MLLSVEKMETYIQQYHILQGISLQVKAGEIAILLGRNGAGKTTTLRSIIGLTPFSKGRVAFDGEQLAGLPPYQIVRKGIGYVPEEQVIFASLTVEENLKIGLRGGKGGGMDFVLDLFPDLKTALKKPGGELSGGQKQMLAIGRALVNRNKLILVDEPSKGLAPIVIEKLVQSFSELKKHTTLLVVEQNFNFAASIGDTYFIIDDGKTVHQGAMAGLKQDSDLQKRYLGIARKGAS